MEYAETSVGKEIAERYADRIDQIYVYFEGGLSDLDDVKELDYAWIEQCREIESDFEDGTGRYVDNYAESKQEKRVFIHDVSQKIVALI